MRNWWIAAIKFINILGIFSQYELIMLASHQFYNTKISINLILWYSLSKTDDTVLEKWRLIFYGSRIDPERRQKIRKVPVPNSGGTRRKLKKNNNKFIGRKSGIGSSIESSNPSMPFPTHHRNKEKNASSHHVFFKLPHPQNTPHFSSSPDFHSRTSSSSSSSTSQSINDNASRSWHSDMHITYQHHYPATDISNGFANSSSSGSNVILSSSHPNNPLIPLSIPNHHNPDKRPSESVNKPSSTNQKKEGKQSSLFYCIFTIYSISTTKIIKILNASYYELVMYYFKLMFMLCYVL